MTQGDLMLHAAQARLDDLRRSAANRPRRRRRRRRRTAAFPPGAAPAVTLRVGSPSDAEALGRLDDALDGEPVLLAEVDGAPCAAMSLVTGATVAHPSHRDLIDLLRVRAAHLSPRRRRLVRA